MGYIPQRSNRGEKPSNTTHLGLSRRGGVLQRQHVQALQPSNKIRNLISIFCRSLQSPCRVIPSWDPLNVFNAMHLAFCGVIIQEQDAMALLDGSLSAALAATNF